MQSFLPAYLQRSAEAAASLARDDGAQAVLAGMADTLVQSFRAGGRLLLAGNGGSAADTEHIAGEFLSRCHFDRAPLPAIALVSGGAALTAFANDYGVTSIFARQIQALGRDGDVLLVLSTSGTSANILACLDAASTAGLTRLGFSGADGGRMAPLCSALFRAPSTDAQIIQQLHMQAAHAVIGLVEHTLFDPPFAE